MSLRQRAFRPALDCLEGRDLPAGGYAQVNLASDVPGLARLTDPNLVNPWGLSYSPTGPFWFGENGTGVSDLLDGAGEAVPLVVGVPGAAGSAGTPTGTVFNRGTGFAISEGGVAAPGRFLFATEDGTISAWSEVVDPTRALVAVDRSLDGAVYKGLALATDADGQSYLYAADFHNNRIDVFDQDFRLVARPGSFRDPDLPTGYAPFNVQEIGEQLFVTYAQQDADRHDHVAGTGLGFVDVYDPRGNLLKRFASGGALDAPWGLALAPAGFGPFGGALLVGNTGDGRISAFDPASGAFLGQLADDAGAPVTIPTLWALTFGNGHAGGDADTLFFTAGLEQELHGLFGAIQAPGRHGADTAGPAPFDPNDPSEPKDYPLPPKNGPALQDRTDDPRPTTVALLPLKDSSLALAPTLTTALLPAAQAPAPVPVAPGVTASTQGAEGTSLVVSGTILLLPAVDDVAHAASAQTVPLSLNGFLDLNPAPMSPADPVAGVVSGEWPAPAPSPAAYSSPSAMPVESAGALAAGNEVVDPHERWSWPVLVNGLLAAVSIPVVWGYVYRARGRSRPPVGPEARTVLVTIHPAPSA